MPRAALFDIDGTLVDSVDLHARAWQEAFSHFGKEIAYDEIRAQIGKGGDQLIPVFLDAKERKALGAKVDEYRAELFGRRYLPQVKPFPGARGVVLRARAAGLRVGLASSCKQAELDHYVDLIGLHGALDAATTGDDVERSKPQPDVFLACARKLDVDPRDAVAVGDSPYDALAARRAGMQAVGVLAGGFPARSLEEAGCVAIYRDCAELLARFDGSPLAPGAGAQPTP